MLDDATSGGKTISIVRSVADDLATGVHVTRMTRIPNERGAEPPVPRGTIEKFDPSSQFVSCRAAG